MAMEIVSSVLTRSVFARIVEKSIEFLQRLEINEVCVTYGFGCACPSENVYRPIAVPLDQLAKYIADSERAGSFKLGDNDLHIDGGGDLFELTICHESDVHFESESVDLVEKVRALWDANGIASTNRPEAPE